MVSQANLTRSEMTARGSSKRYEQKISAGVQLVPLPASPAIVFIAQPRRLALFDTKVFRIPG